jgi:predicted transcriptional regulator
MTRDLVKAQIEQRNIDADNLGDWLKSTHGTLLDLWRQGYAPHADPMGNPIDWRESIGLERITCMVCGKALKQLSPQHIKQHGMTARQYRERFGMPPTQPLSSRRVTHRRSQAVRRTKPWLKATAARWPKGRRE